MLATLLACGGGSDVDREQRPVSTDAPGALAGTSAPTSEDDPFAVADRLLAEREFADAEAAYDDLLASAREAGRREDRWRAALGRARAEAGEGGPADFAAAFALALELADELPSRVAPTLYYQSTALFRRGELAAGLELAERCLRAAEATRDAQDLSMAYGALGTGYSLAGRYDDSLAVNERRVALWRQERPGSSELALALNNVGIDYRHFGRYGEAIGVYEEARGIYRRLDDRRRLSMVLYNLGSVYGDLGAADRDLELKLSALETLPPDGDPYGLGLIHGNLGALYRGAGNFALARRHLEEALEIHRRASQPYGETIVLESLSRLELDVGNLDDAEDLARRAVGAADGRGFANEQVTARSALVRSLAAEGRAKEALAEGREAVRRSVTLGDPAVELDARAALAVALEADGGPAAAAYLDAIELLDSWRGRLGLGDLAMTAAAPYTAVYEGAVRSLVAEGRIEEAFVVAERSRARRLLELMAQRYDEEQRSRRAELVRRLGERERARLESAADRRPAIEREINDLLAELQGVDAELRRRDPVRAGLTLPSAASLAEIRARLCAGDRVALEIFWGERDVFAWWVARGRLEGRRLGSARDLGAMVDLARGLLADETTGDAWRAPAARLGELLLPSLRGAEQVVVVGDGPLATFPFETLLDGAGLPLAATASVVYGPSASVLLALASRPPARRVDRTLLAVADPSFQGAAARIEGSARVGLDPLPYARREVEALADLFPRAQVETLVGSQATLEAWMAQRPARYRFLHFATHARVSERRPQETSILLADRPLALPAIRRLELDADLVTLSACETALGQAVRGEGLVGLSHAFLAAGAGGTVVSLWRVEDRAAESFMVRLYVALAAGEPPAEALRRARLDAGAARGAHPVSWSPFVVVGGLS